MEKAMQIDNIKYAVIGAMMAAAMAIVVNLQSGNMFGVLLAIGYEAAVYFTVLAKLTTDVSAAAGAAFVLAFLAVGLCLYAVVTQNPVFIFVNLIAAASLGYACMQLKELAKGSAARPDPGAPSSRS